jgi:hypothetical protein
MPQMTQWAATEICMGRGPSLLSHILEVCIHCFVAKYALITTKRSSDYSVKRQPQTHFPLDGLLSLKPELSPQSLLNLRGWGGGDLDSLVIRKCS